jgi:hypothetical protein
VCHTFGTPPCSEPRLLAGCEHVGVVLREDVVAALNANPAFAVPPNTLEICAGAGGAPGCVLRTADAGAPLPRARRLLCAAARHGAGAHACVDYLQALERLHAGGSGSGGCGGVDAGPLFLSQPDG